MVRPAHPRYLITESIPNPVRATDRAVTGRDRDQTLKGVVADGHGLERDASSERRYAAEVLARFPRPRSCAFNATITVDADIMTAPSAGDSRIPMRANTPAASGIAMAL